MYHCRSPPRLTRNNAGAFGPAEFRPVKRHTRKPHERIVAYALFGAEACFMPVRSLLA